MADPYPADLVRLVGEARARLGARMEELTPGLAGPAATWIASLSANGPAGYFTHPSAYPMLLLPWWLDVSIGRSPDLALQGEVVYSSVCGYYFVRLIDDLMDDRSGPPSAVLPALIVFHTEFVRAYHRLFPSDHPFWPSFVGSSYAAAETAAIDASLAHIGRDDFLRYSSRKVAGAKIPLAAVAHHHRRSELIDPWSEVADAIGRWHQMRNDVIGWPRDLAAGRITYLLSEALRHSDDEQSVAEWIASRGLAWAQAELSEWMEQALSTARRLGSPGLVAYLDQRRREAAAEWQAISADLPAVRRLARAARRPRG